MDFPHKQRSCLWPNLAAAISVFSRALATSRIRIADPTEMF
jgi:hypothetical protein